MYHNLHETFFTWNIFVRFKGLNSEKFNVNENIVLTFIMVVNFQV